MYTIKKASSVPNRGRGGTGPRTPITRALDAAQPGDMFEIPNTDLPDNPNPQSTLHNYARRYGKRIVTRKQDDHLAVYITGLRN